MKVVGYGLFMYRGNTSDSFAGKLFILQCQFAMSFVIFLDSAALAFVLPE